MCLSDFFGYPQGEVAVKKLVCLNFEPQAKSGFSSFRQQALLRVKKSLQHDFLSQFLF